MLVIRLQRIGKKHQPSYRLVVAERRSKVGGPPVEHLGSYDIQAKKAQFKGDRILHWIGKGARPSDTVHNLLVREGVLTGKKIAVHKKKKAVAGGEEKKEIPVAASAE